MNKLEKVWEEFRERWVPSLMTGACNGSSDGNLAVITVKVDDAAKQFVSEGQCPQYEHELIRRWKKTNGATILALQEKWAAV